MGQGRYNLSDKDKGQNGKQLVDIYKDQQFLILCQRLYQKIVLVLNKNTRIHIDGKPIDKKALSFACNNLKLQLSKKSRINPTGLLTKFDFLQSTALRTLFIAINMLNTSNQGAVLRNKLTNQPRNQEKTKRQKENIATRMLAYERENNVSLQSSKIYHNFVNKKNKKVNHMSKIIDRVISQDIEPWNLENSNVYKILNIKSQQNRKKCNISNDLQLPWQRDVLGNYNSIMEPY